MITYSLLLLISALMPLCIMLTSALASRKQNITAQTMWRRFNLSTGLALLFTIMACVMQMGHMAPDQLVLPGLNTSPIQSWVTLLVQILGTVIGVFSSRYLQGEFRQQPFIASFAGVLTAVHLLILADHWLILIGAWAAIGFALQQLLCFYQKRPFAMLAAHKKFIADRIADILLLAAAALAWWEVGSGSLSALSNYLKHHEISLLMQICAVLLVLAVMIRTALFPVHGWLIQVMEAPTPVSAMLHAGVVNLSGFVLIRFAPLLDAAAPARWLLVMFGLTTAMLAGLVMLTRISIKVKLAWSTVAQMGFMVLECGLGLYTLAAMHLLGHSLYKAHAFLSASNVVQQSNLLQLRSPHQFVPVSFLCSPLAALACIVVAQHLISSAHWPWWWSVILALAWAPFLWLQQQNTLSLLRQFINGIAMVAGLSVIASFVHQMPLSTTDAHHLEAGLFAMAGMTIMYLTLILIQLYPKPLSAFQRWSYAGFYVDEAYTRLTLKLWPIDWASAEKTPAQS